MKKTAVPALVILILSLIAAAGSQTFIGPCVHEDGSFGACHWAGQMLLGVGCLLAVLALLALFLPKQRSGLYLAILPAAVLGIAAPNGLIALCKMDDMRCRMLMRPAMTVLFVIILIAGAAGTVLSLKKDGRP